MRTSIISLLSALGFACAALAAAATSPLTIKPDAPQRYIVVRGDTLWGISGRYLAHPWQWPSLWRMNRDAITNPHWIYPGDILVLAYDQNGNPYLSKLGSNGDVSYGYGGTGKLEPQVRGEPVGGSVPSIPANLIEPFLKRPLVVDEAQFENAPRLVAGPDSRMIFTHNDRVYAVGVNAEGTWQAYRPGRELRDPDTGENLGYEAIYGGDLTVDKLGPIESLRVLNGDEEIQVGDRLMQAPQQLFVNYVPHAPEHAIQGRIIATPNGVAEIGQYQSVTLNRGKREGVEVGHVFGVFKKGIPVEVSKNILGMGKTAVLPAEEVGELFVYRVYDKVSYALIMKSQSAINVGDLVAPPEQ
jgi:hypothetical protein